MIQSEQIVLSATVQVKVCIYCDILKFTSAAPDTVLHLSIIVGFSSLIPLFNKTHFEKLSLIPHIPFQITKDAACVYVDAHVSARSSTI